MTSLNLATDTWIPTLRNNTTPDVVSLIDLFTHADKHRLDVGNILHERALTRLLLAITYSAYGDDATTHTYGDPVDTVRVAEWLAENAHHFDVFSPTRPFLQDPTLADTDDLLPAGLLDVTACKDRPILTDHRFDIDVLDWSPVEAVFHLLTLQFLAPYGYSRGVSVSMSAGVFYTYTVSFPGSVAHELQWLFTPTELPGEATWTFHDRGSEYLTPLTEAEGCAWMPRRVLLHVEDGRVAQYRLNQGWKLDTEKADATPGRRDVAPVLVRALMDANPKQPYRNLTQRLSPYVLADVVREKAHSCSVVGRLGAFLDANPHTSAPPMWLVGTDCNKALVLEVQRVPVADLRTGWDKKRADVEQDVLRSAGAPLSRSVHAHITGSVETPERSAPQWPVWNAPVFNTRTEADTETDDSADSTESVSADDALLAQLLATTEHATGTDQEKAAGRMRHALKPGDDHTPNTCATCARMTPAERTVATMIWSSHWRVIDNGTPLPECFTILGARTGNWDHIRDLFTAITDTANPQASTPELAELVETCARHDIAFSTLSLVHDLTHWDTHTATRWRETVRKKPERKESDNTTHVTHIEHV